MGAIDTNWTSEQKQRFNQLRLRALDGLLSAAEQEELHQMRAEIALIEEATMAPALTKLEQGNARLQTMLTELTQENTDLLALSQRQKRLIIDTKQWIAEFEQRYALIQSDFVRLTQSPFAGS